MNLILLTDFGCTEAVIDEDCGLKRFYEVAGMLTDNPYISFNKKSDEFDSLMWEFNYKKQLLILHYNIYTGISIFQRTLKEAVKTEIRAVEEVAGFLESKLMVNTAKKYIS